MKKILMLLIANLIAVNFIYSQSGVSINTTGAPADNSAILDVSSIRSPFRGLLLPRMSTANRPAKPVESLIIFNTDTRCFEAYNSTTSQWISIGCLSGCKEPATLGSITGNSTPCQNATGVAYSISPVNTATSYTWTVPQGATIAGGQGTTAITVNYGTTDGNVCVTASNSCGTSSASCQVITLSAGVSAPTPGTHTASTLQIVWRWNTVSGATGYKWNTVNNYNTATDNGTSTTYTQTGLTCSSAYVLYVWAYNLCGNSGATTLTQLTSPCPFNCGSNLVVTHTAGVNGAPVTKTVSYGTVTTSISGASHCWITQNLGADQQATSATDATEASAGWYWQYNRIQGYKNDGPNGSTNNIPAVTWDATNDKTYTPVPPSTRGWDQAKDPCTLLLGAGWRLPTIDELSIVVGMYTPQQWKNYNDSYATELKLHAAGLLQSSDGMLMSRSTYGGYSCYGAIWSSDENVIVSDKIWGWYLTFFSNSSYVTENYKSTGFNVRCLK